MLRSAFGCNIVREASHLALLVLLVILDPPSECGAALDLSGEWESVVTVEPVTGTWAIETDFTVEMDFGDWMTATRTLFEDRVWKSQEFGVEGTIGEIDIESDLRFEPYLNRFRDWITELEWEFDEMAVALTTELTQSTDWLILELEREWEVIEIGTSIRLRAPTGSCLLLFYDASADIAFDWCGIETDLGIVFDDDGFDEFVVEFSDLDIVRIPWLTFDLEITRTVEATTVEFSPDVVLESPWCGGGFDLELEGDLPSAPNLLPISIDEASLTWEVEEWEIEANVYFNANDWIDDLYWLEVEAETAFDLDPSGEVALELALLWTESTLGRAQSVLTYEPGDKVSIAIEGNINLDDGLLDWLALELQMEW